MDGLAVSVVDGVADGEGVILGVGVLVLLEEDVGVGVVLGVGVDVLLGVGVGEGVLEGVGACATLKVGDVPVYAEPPGSWTDISNAYTFDEDGVVVLGQINLYVPLAKTGTLDTESKVCVPENPVCRRS